MDLRGATILLTGATDGIGRETARRLAGQAQTLLVHGPQVHGPQPSEAVRDLVAELRSRAQSPERTIYLQANYTELAQVRRLAAQVHELTDHLDLLINNAGRAGPGSRIVSRDGNEVTLQTNYLAAVALTDPASRGAANIIHAATAADGNGAYFDEERLSRPHPDALDPEVQERLHRVTQDLIARST